MGWAESIQGDPTVTTTEETEHTEKGGMLRGGLRSAIGGLGRRLGGGRGLGCRGAFHGDAVLVF